MVKSHGAPVGPLSRKVDFSRLISIPGGLSSSSETLPHLLRTIQQHPTEKKKKNDRNSRGHLRALKPFLPKQTRDGSQNPTCQSKIDLIFGSCIVCRLLRGITDLTLGSWPNSAHSAALAAASFQNNLLKSQKKHSGGVNLHPLGEIAKTQGPGCLFKGQEERGS